MSAITNWQLSVSGIGGAQIYTEEWRYAGGFVIAGLGGGADEFAVYNLGNSEIALSVGMQDQDGNNYTFYWNSHYGLGPDGDGYYGGMMLWHSNDDYTSDAIGPEQTFKLYNLGNGNVALQPIAGPSGGQYLAGTQGGWYPDQFGDGNGCFTVSASPAALQLQGDLLALVQITNSGYETNLAGRDLRGMSLAGANMQRCVLDGASLVGVTSLQGADFTGAHMHGVHLGGLDLSTAKTWLQADFTSSDLTNIAPAAAPAQLPSAILDGVNLSGCHLAGAVLTGASLKGAWLTATDLTGAHLEGADLTGAHMDRTILHGAGLEGTHFDGVDLSTAQFDSAPSFTRALSPRTTFVGATVPFSLLASNWSYLDLTSATITGLPRAIDKLVADGALLPDGLSLQGIDLTGASFAATRMYEAQLQNANLQSANLQKALLKGAKLNGANLTLANLDSAFLIAETGAVRMRLEQDKLEAAVVTDAFMFNTVLDGAHCDGVDFSGSLFVTADAFGDQQASAIGASMNFAKFDTAHTVLAVFDGAQLSAASFASGTLVAASFQDHGTSATQLTPSSDSTHTPASLYEADIRGTNFTGANMDGADMRHAVYSTTTGSFEKLYDSYDNGTKIPVAFDYGATKLGDTTVNTTCPGGSAGPCSLTAAVAEHAS